MLIIVVLIVSLVIGYALYSNFSTQKQKFTSTDTELSLRNILNLNEDPTELCNLWKNMENNEAFQITIDGENAAQLSSDKSKPPKTTFDKSSTDALNKIVVDHINKICNSKKPTKDTNTTTTTPPKPTNNAQPATPPAPDSAPTEAEPSATNPAYLMPSVSADSVENAAANDVAGQAGQEPANSANNSGESEPAPGVEEANSKIVEVFGKYKDDVIEKVDLPDIKVINLREEDICKQWKNIEADEVFVVTRNGNNVLNLDDSDAPEPYKRIKSAEDEIAKKLNEICNTPQQPAPQAQQAAPQTRPEQSLVNTNPNQPQSQPQTNTEPAESSYNTALTTNQRTKQETQFMNRRNDFLAILRDGKKLEMKNFKNDEKNMFIDELNNILADIKIKFEQRLGIKIEDDMDLTKLNELGFVRLAKGDEKFEKFFRSFVSSNLINLEDKISVAKRKNANVENVLDCFTWLQQILFGEEQGNPSLSHKVEEALRVRYLDLDGVTSDGIVSDYDRDRIKMASTDMPNRVMYFGNGEGSTDKLIFGSDSVLFNLVKIDIKNNDPIRVQIIEHYGEDREQDCYPGEKREQTYEPIIDSFYYTDENLNIISNNNTKKGKYLKLDKGQVGRIFTDFGAFETFIGKIKEARRNLKSHSRENRIRRHFINEQSRSHLIVHLFKPDKNEPYATIMDIAKSEPIISEPIIDGANNVTNNPLFVEEEIIKKKWRDLFLDESEGQTYKDLSGVIKKVQKAIKFITDKENFNTAEKKLKDKKISHLYKNENGNIVDLIHGGSNMPRRQQRGGEDEEGEFVDARTNDTGTESLLDLPGISADEYNNEIDENLNDINEISRLIEELDETKIALKTAEGKAAEKEKALVEAKKVAEQKEKEAQENRNALDKANSDNEKYQQELQDAKAVASKAEVAAKTAIEDANQKNAAAQAANEKAEKAAIEVKRANKDAELAVEAAMAEQKRAEQTAENDKKAKEAAERRAADAQVAADEAQRAEEAAKSRAEIAEEEASRAQDAADTAQRAADEATEAKKAAEMREENAQRVAETNETVIRDLNNEKSKLQESISELTSTHNRLEEENSQLRQFLDEAVDKMEQQKEEIKILKGNTEGDLAFERSFEEFFNIIDFKEGNQPLYTDIPLKNTFRPEREDLWLFNENEYKHFKNDKQNYQTIELHKLRNEIDKFELKPGNVSDKWKPFNRSVYNVIFRAYLYNKLIEKVNQFLKDQNLEIQFHPIKKFDADLFIELGKLSIPELAKSPLFQNWKKPDQEIFSKEQEDFLQIWKKNFEKSTLKSTFEIRGYENMRNDFMDKVFCPVFHSAKYINRTYPIIDKYIKHINGDIRIDVKKLDDKIELKIVENLKIDFSADKNFTTIVHVKFNGGRKFGGGARAMRGGSRYMNFKLSSRSVERIQNVSYYNIVKTIRWRYYLSRKKTEESIEVTIFKDYLFTLIACVFLLAAGNDKLAYGTFTDQLLSIGLFYEFDQDLTALLLPYYLPFT
jgi:hypothetical protein